VSYVSNNRGAGVTKTGGVTLGFGELGTQGFNVFGGGIEVSKRDAVMYSELKNRGSFQRYNDDLNTNGTVSRHTPDSSASFYANYYRVPESLTGSTSIDGRSVANSNLSGANCLGTFSGCPDERMVGKGVPKRPAGFSSTTASLRDGACRFNPDDAAQASVASTAVNVGKSEVLSLDLRGSRTLFQLQGGPAAIAVGAELRREKLQAIPDDPYLAGDNIGLVANGASGSRNLQAVFTEMSLPVLKPLELLGALRYERYSDFGNSTTGKFGLKGDALPSIMSLRGTAATGLRAPSIAQIGNSFASSFHTSQKRRLVDSLRCTVSGDTYTSKADPPINWDANSAGQLGRRFKANLNYDFK
jgi:hypothetical protein